MFRVDFRRAALTIAGADLVVFRSSFIWSSLRLVIVAFGFFVSRLTIDRLLILHLIDVGLESAVVLFRPFACLPVVIDKLAVRRLDGGLTSAFSAFKFGPFFMIFRRWAWGQAVLTTRLLRFSLRSHILPGV